MNTRLSCIFFGGLLLFSACKSGKETAAVSDSPLSSVVSEKDQVGFTYVFLNAAREKMLGNYETAAALYRESLRLNPTDPAPYYELANLYYQLGKPEEARAMAKKAVELSPGNSWFRLLYIGILQEQEDYASATRELEKLRKLQPEKLEYQYDYANALLSSGKIAEAIKEYDAIESKIGITEDISRQKQRIYLSMNNTEKAVAEIEKLIKAYPDEPRYLAILADIYRSNELPEQAIKVYNRLLEKDPENPFALLSMADYHRENGDAIKAFSFLKRAYKNPSLDIDTKVKILLSYYVLSENDPELKKEAYDLVKILGETHPEEAKSFAIAGDFYVRDGNYTEARDQFRKAVSLDKSRLPVWTQLLVLEADLGDNKALLEESTEAAGLFPVDPSLHFFRGIAYSRLREFEKAIEPLETAAALVVDDRGLSGQIYSALGDAHHQLGNHNESDRAYDKALSYDPSNVFVLNNYSYYLSLRGKDLSRAATMALKANEKQPGNASFQDTYGWILYMQGDYTEAEKWLNKALESDGGNSAVILEHYGDVLFRLNKKDEAIKTWKKAFQKAPENSALKEKIERGIIP